jgi:hypothetical protein
MKKSKKVKVSKKVKKNVDKWLDVFSKIDLDKLLKDIK